jgi:hypothetical protein
LINVASGRGFQFCAPLPDASTPMRGAKYEDSEMDTKTDSKTLQQLAIEAADDFGFAVEVNDEGLLRIYDPDDDYIDPDDDGEEGDRHRSSDGDESEWLPPQIIIAACRCNAWKRDFFKNDTWRQNIMAGMDASEATVEIEGELRLLRKIRRLVWNDNVPNDDLDEIVRLVGMIKKDRNL